MSGHTFNTLNLTIKLDDEDEESEDNMKIPATMAEDEEIDFEAIVSTKNAEIERLKLELQNKDKYIHRLEKNILKHKRAKGELLPVEAIFNLLDLDGDGQISKKQIKKVLSNMCPEVVDERFLNSNADKIDKENFVPLIGNVLMEAAHSDDGYSESEEDISDEIPSKGRHHIRNSSRRYDDDPNCGFLSVGKLKKALGNFGVPEEQLVAFDEKFSYVDVHLMKHCFSE